jgi:hypothetical protein
MIYQNIKDSVQFRIPKLTISGDNTVDVNVTLITHGNKVGASQIGLKYDPQIFKFVGVSVGQEASAWNSFISSKSGEILWGGHESKMAPSLITNPTQMFNFKFEILNNNWEEAPIQIINKAAGNEKAQDLNIIPSPTDATIVNGRRARDLVDQLVNGFRVYPNPVVDEMYVDYFQTTPDNLTSEIFDLSGKLHLRETQFVAQDQTVTRRIETNTLEPGLYFVRLTTGTKQKIYKFIKK